MTRTEGRTNWQPAGLETSRQTEEPLTLPTRARALVTAYNVWSYSSDGQGMTDPEHLRNIEAIAAAPPAAKVLEILVQAGGLMGSNAEVFMENARPPMPVLEGEAYLLDLINRNLDNWTRNINAEDEGWKEMARVARRMRIGDRVDRNPCINDEARVRLMIQHMLSIFGRFLKDTFIKRRR